MRLREPFSPRRCAGIWWRPFRICKAIGLDFLSVGTPANQLSKQAHRILFGCHNGKYIPAIEDMDLRPLFETETPLKSVIAAPLRLGKVDSSQVTVIGEFRE